MTINLANFNEVHVPIYLLEEERLRNNLSLIRSVAERADVEIILAFKAYALWKLFLYSVSIFIPLQPAR